MSRPTAGILRNVEAACGNDPRLRSGTRDEKVGRLGKLPRDAPGLLQMLGKEAGGRCGGEVHP